MRVTTVLNRLLCLAGVSVTGVIFEPDAVVVDVRRSAVSTRSTQSPSSPPPSTWSVERRGTSSVNYPTKAPRRFKGARWSLLKHPENLTDDQATTLRQLRRRGGDLWRAYTLKEAFRAIFAGDLDPDETAELIDRWCSQASRSRLAPFVKVAKTIRKFRDQILAAIRLKINNARAEGLNNHVIIRLITRRAYGFHSPTAALALVMLSCGPIKLHLLHEQPPR